MMVIDPPGSRAAIPPKAGHLLVTEFARTTQALQRKKQRTASGVEARAVGRRFRQVLVTSIARPDGAKENTRLAQVLTWSRSYATVLMDHLAVPDGSCSLGAFATGFTVIPQQMIRQWRSMIEQGLKAMGVPFIATNLARRLNRLQVSIGRGHIRRETIRLSPWCLLDLRCRRWTAFTPHPPSSDPPSAGMPVVIHLSLTEARAM
jgi:two-component system chemotaxis response regulator CheV